MAQIKTKADPIYAQLGISESSVSRVGSSHVGYVGSYGYVWNNGAIHEVRCPSVLTLSSLHTTEIESISGAVLEGHNGQHHVFRSQSGALRVSDADATTDIYVVSNSDVQKATVALAQHLSDLSSTLSAAISHSATAQYLTYSGKELDLEGTHDEFDLVLEPKDKFSLTFVRGDEYALRLKDDPSITFSLRGHKLVQNILSQTDAIDKVGAVSTNARSIFTYAGTTKQNIFRPIRIEAGTDIYRMKSDLYFGYNLAVPISRLVPANSLDRLLDKCQQLPGKQDIVNGKMGKAPASSPKLVPVKANARIWAAAVPVSANQIHRSRIFMDPRREEVLLRVQEHVQNLRVPVDYLLFETTSADPLYDEVASARVIIKNSNVIQSKYKTIRVSSPIRIDEMIATEPRDNPPALDLPCTEKNRVQTLIRIRSLIDQGYFLTGIRMSAKQESSGITFEAAFFDDRRYNMVVGAARRIATWLKQQGVPVTNRTISIDRGQKMARIVFHFPVPRDPKSIEKLRDDPPLLNTPVYENTTRHEPIVEIVDTNIHTGMVTVRMQRSPQLYAAPYVERYELISRRSL